MPEKSDIFDFDRSRLTLKYDVERLQQETTDALHQTPPYIHYSAVPLTMPGVQNNEIADFSNPDWTTWVESRLLSACPYIRTVLSSLECRKTNVRILRLEPGGEIKEHKDPQLDLQFRNQVRLHVPVFTNELVTFTLNGTPVPLLPGELWYMRLSDSHSVRNEAPTERIHLSIDVVVNEWLENMIIQGETA
jgi:hypothetical protein